MKFVWSFSCAFSFLYRSLYFAGWLHIDILTICLKVNLIYILANMKMIAELNQRLKSNNLPPSGSNDRVSLGSAKNKEQKISNE